jgi:hypothetical protein
MTAAAAAAAANNIHDPLADLITPKPSEGPIPRQESIDRLRVTRAMAKASVASDDRRASVERVDSGDIPPKKKGRFTVTEVPRSAASGAFN